ncbi:hypothetical protein K458DRAFT_158874 [Lentithecium fluviatile CBS 122367]|uniref:Uncharacterized protein n=1 Tax=Lentithecium fluviatile CBS 122367 TaxID=1168545 RepID=A0A6G1II24_9PLEO|nr:hypothetical protein K458DRAFT_158874 [Lentithecium fluviatile CBS 122367]
MLPTCAAPVLSPLEHTAAVPADRQHRRAHRARERIHGAQSPLPTCSTRQRIYIASDTQPPLIRCLFTTPSCFRCLISCMGGLDEGRSLDVTVSQSGRWKAVASAHSRAGLS